MIESVTRTTVIFIDHVANFSIVKQTTLSSENIDKFNFRFVRFSTYLSQFNIDVRYKTEKINIVSNALFRLSAINFSKSVEHMNTLNIDSYHCSMQNISISAHAFQESLIFMISNFRTKLIENYFEDKIWSKIMKSLKILNIRISMKNVERDETIRTNIDFEMHNELIYYKENRRLCIFKFMKRKIFNLIHDNNQHFDDTRCFYRIRESLFISRLFKKLRTYIDHCFQCQFNQIKRHKTYEKLMSISFSSISFHTVIMNFIMIISNDLNILLTITCKFSKRITIISDKSTYNVRNWIIKMMNRLLTIDWNIFAAIIFDRDSKFLSEFWDTIFKKLNVFLLISTAYHAQTNEQFEKSNQTVEIAIRFLYSNDFDVNIVSALSTIQSQLNNSFNVSTDFALNEIIYDFKVRDTISTLNQNQTNESFANKRKKY